MEWRAFDVFRILHRACWGMRRQFERSSRTAWASLAVALRDSAIWRLHVGRRHRGVGTPSVRRVMRQGRAELHGENMSTASDEAWQLERERRDLLERVERWLEVPMLVLAFVWLVLLGVELLWEDFWKRNPLLNPLSTTIWIVFIVNFVVELVLAPRRLDYARRNWLTIVSLVVPALRLFRVFRVVRVLRAARATRGIRLVRLLSSLNRGMRALGASMTRRGFGYVAGLTVIITLAGAAGMFAFENESAGGLDSYGEALWWTAMIMTTMGSAYWPQTPEGRVLCVVLALYAFAVFGYVTATLATYFIGRDAASEQAELAGAQAIAELRSEITGLRAEIRECLGRNRNGSRVRDADGE